LNKTIKPIHYDISLKPDLINSTFSGQVKIQLNVLQNTESIVIDTVELDILSASIEQESKVLPLSTNYDQENETATLLCTQEIKKGNRVLY